MLERSRRRRHHDHARDRLLLERGSSAADGGNRDGGPRRVPSDVVTQASGEWRGDAPHTHQRARGHHDPQRRLTWRRATEQTKFDDEGADGCVDATAVVVDDEVVSATLLAEGVAETVETEVQVASRDRCVGDARIAATTTLQSVLIIKWTPWNGSTVSEPRTRADATARAETLRQRPSTEREDLFTGKPRRATELAVWKTERVKEADVLVAFLTPANVAWLDKAITPQPEDPCAAASVWKECIEPRDSVESTVQDVECKLKKGKSATAVTTEATLLGGPLVHHAVFQLHRLHFAGVEPAALRRLIQTPVPKNSSPGKRRPLTCPHGLAKAARGKAGRAESKLFQRIGDRAQSGGVKGKNVDCGHVTREVTIDDALANARRLPHAATDEKAAFSSLLQSTQHIATIALGAPPHSSVS